MSASQLKTQGNSLFTAGHYAQAIDCYSKAMLKDPGDSKFYGNRALCYNRLHRFQDALTDCHRAIELNSRYAKAFYFLGEALIGLEKYGDAGEALNKALHLANEQQLFFGDEITSRIKMAKTLRWKQKEEIRLKEGIELQSYLNKVIDDQKRRTLDSNISMPADEVEADCERRKAQVGDLFAIADERRAKREVPDYLCCQISFELMRDPVVTPSGVTYDRSSIEEHLERVGHFDPVTRSPMQRSDLTPNLALKEIIEDFRTKHEWADDY